MYIRDKSTQIIFKRYVDDVFKGTCAFPSVKYPLNGKPEVFSVENTEQIMDSKMIEVIDQQEFCIGRCYTNTRKMVAALRDAGYEATSYVGWLLFSENQTPVHHCWTMVGNHLIDLADDYALMLHGENGEYLRSSGSGTEMRERMAEFEIEASKLPHSQRCAPLGVPAGFLLYVGSPCSPEEGIKIFKQLMVQFPDHECNRRYRNTGMTHTQAVMAEYGLMGWIKK